MPRTRYSWQRPGDLDIRYGVYPLVGREQDLAALHAHRLRGERLLTIIGPAGVGKTHLARAFAEQCAEISVGALRPAYCSLTDAAELSDLTVRVALALGLRERLPGKETLSLRGRGTGVVLVLDSLDALAAEAGHLLRGWIDKSELHILVTSRNRLPHAARAVVHELGPLSTRSEAGHPSKAVEMFACCARRVVPSFALTQESAPLVHELVESVEGLPLAIELAALRMGVLGPKDLLARWFEEEHGSRLPRDTRIPLERTFARSWDCLDPIERSALAQCSVFRGGFSAASAEAVVEIEGPRPLLDVLQSLRDRSLLRLDQVQESLRLGMHLLVRAFAAAHLSEQQERLVRDRHAVHFLDLEHATLADYDNIMSALSHCRRTQRPDAWLRALLKVAPVLMARGPVLSFVRQLDEALCQAQPLSLDDRIASLRARSAACRAYGDIHAALEDASRARLLATDNQTLAYALIEEASIRVMTSDVELADRQLQEALGLLEGISLPTVELEASIALACLRLDCARTEEAWRLLRRAMTLATRQEARGGWQRGQVLGLMGLAELDVGNLDKAGDLLEQALQWMANAPVRRKAYFLAYAAQVAHETGDLALASARYDQALDTLVSVGDERGESWILALKGSIAAAEDQIQTATELFGKAQDLAQRCTDVQASLVVDMLRGCLDLARARRGERGAEAGARARMRRATEGTAAPASRYLDIRFALRLVTNGLLGFSVAPPSLTVAADGSWFRVGDEAVVVLARHRALSLLLAHLVRLRTTCPGQAICPRDLIAVGWPGEKVRPQSGINRVHVSLTKLRKLGLASMIVSTQSGCLLDPDVRVTRIDVDPRRPEAKNG